MFNGYFGQNSECLAGFTGLKLRQRGLQTGPATLGVCLQNDAVANAATRMMRELSYSGIVDMDFRYDARDGQYKLLDVNPRLGGSFRLFVADNGVDVVRAAYLDLTGQPVPANHARDGRGWLVEPYDLVVAGQMAVQRRLNLPAWARSLRAVDEAAWWSADDPAPFLTMWAPFLSVCVSLVSLALQSHVGLGRSTSIISTDLRPRPSGPSRSCHRQRLSKHKVAPPGASRWSR
jgi:predicted ATP-grasp superfamily ATP-dependent carboligase